MGHPLRHLEPDAIYFVTNYTLHRKFFLKPDGTVNEIVLGLLAKTAQRYGIEIFAFVFMANHFHLMARSKAMQLHLFLKDFQSTLARKLNLHWGRTGTFFPRRYTSSKILDDQLIDKLRYTICNPCESNLVRHPKLWPGLSSWTIHAEQKPLVGRVVNREVYWALKRKKANQDKTEAELVEMATEEYRLEMAKLPQWKDLDDEAYHDKVVETCIEHAGGLADRRNTPCMGAQKILAQKWYDRPKNPRQHNARRPLCHTNCPKKRQEHRDGYREIVDLYKQAVGKWREGKSPVHFPRGTIPPGHLDCIGGGQALRPQGEPSPG